MPFLKSDVLITDATGIKGSLPEDVQRLLTGRMEFIAGHPMAGRQGSGFGMSQAEIFDGANYIVVPAAFNSSGAIEWLSSFAGAIGCGQVVQVDAVEHDRIIAYTSNLPHALAVALINSASYNENTKYFIAGSFQRWNKGSRYQSVFMERFVFGEQGKRSAGISCIQPAVGTLARSSDSCRRAAPAGNDAGSCD